MTVESPYCEAQVGGMECGFPVFHWGEQCTKHDPERTTMKGGDKSTMDEIHIGDAVEYFDELGSPHVALITAIWGPADGTPSINLLWVSGDGDKMDTYGRQIERNTSVVHEHQQSAHGRFWRRLKS